MKIKHIIFSVLSLILFTITANAESNGYLVKFKDGFQPGADSALHEVYPEKGIYLSETENFSVTEGIESITENSRVYLIDSEETAEIFSLPDDELYSSQWQLQMINADSAWKSEAYGNNVKVAVIDSGCIEHKDLKGNVLEGKNYFDNSADVTDNKGHGTHVSGIIASEMNGDGITGVAPKAKIVPLKCFDPSETTYVDDILGAIYDAVDVYGCDIINMSWGVAVDAPLLKEAIDYAAGKGVLLIAAAGNSGSKTLYYPAAYENVIGVGSVSMNKTKSYFSQFNESVFITAPGEKVLSTYIDGDYRLMQGTSQATPMISGLAAVALSIKSNLTFKDLSRILSETAEDLGAEGYDVYYGYGLVDINAFINKLVKDEVYVSPVNKNGNEAYVLIRNNQNEVLRATSIFSEYNKSHLVGCNKGEIILMPGKEAIIKTRYNSGHSVSHFLWNKVDYMKPLTKKRELNN